MDDNRVSGEHPAGLPGPIKARVEGVAVFPGPAHLDYTVHPDLPTALHWVLDHFDAPLLRAGTAHLWQAERPHRGCRLYRVDGQELLVLPNDGGECAAEPVMALLPQRGYRAVSPASTTPLAALRPHLSVRIYNMLAREGFSTVEQVAAVPDTALLDIRSMGGPSLTAVRDAIATVGAARGGPVTGVRLTAEQVRELTGLLATLSAYAAGRENHALARRADTFLLALTGTAPADVTQTSDEP